MSGLDPRSLRRAFLRGALAFVGALVPSLLARRLVAIPPCVALVLVPYSLIELARARRSSKVIFLIATLLCAFAFANGIYLDGVVGGGSIEAGLGALARFLGEGSSRVQVVLGVAVAAQTVALAFVFAYEMDASEPNESLLNSAVVGPPLLAVEIGALVLFVKVTAAPVAALISYFITVSLAFLGAVFIRGVALIADAIEVRLWPIEVDPRGPRAETM